MDEQRYALHLSAVGRVVPAVEVTPLPKAPEIVRGVVNVQGQVLPVLDIRKQLRLPEQEINLSHHLIISHTSSLNVALLTDTVIGLVQCMEQDIIKPEKIFPGIDYVRGAVKLEDGLVFIYDLERFLSLEEKQEIIDQLTRQDVVLGNGEEGSAND